MQTTESFKDFTTARAWVEDHGGVVFPTYASFEWFTRVHRARLVESGQYIVRKGSAGSLIGPEFERVALAILREESQATLNAEGLAA